MFCKTPLFTITLALLATASPVKKAGGIHVALSPPPTLTKLDGTFDLETAILHDVATQKYIAAACRMVTKVLTTIHRFYSKHRQNLMNLERNAGREAFNEVSLSVSDKRQPSLTVGCRI
jgi:cathepsin D